MDLTQELACDRVHSEVDDASTSELFAYFCGACRDGTHSRRHGTFRISQSDVAWLEVLQHVLQRLERRSWIYREGQRNVWVIETSMLPATPGEEAVEGVGAAAAFARGYFDAEGGIPRDPTARFYIQLVQKDKDDLMRLRRHLETLGISCGRLHNPSVRVDPDYWRVFVRAASHTAFIRQVRSWHPRKRALLEHRMRYPQAVIDLARRVG